MTETATTALTAVILLSVLPAKAETLLERGTYLVESIVACGNCHTAPMPGSPELAGFENLSVVAEFTAHAPNITQDIDTGIGSWTDAQIAAAIREGRRPDGTLIGPPMPIELYRGLSDRDVNAIVTYLRAVKPVKNVSKKSVYNIPLPPTYGPPVSGVEDVDGSDRLALGAYLAGPAGHCIECHTPLGDRGPDFENSLGRGGREFPGPWGISVSPEITASALEDYSDEELRNMIAKGVRPDGTKMLPPMGYDYYARMNDRDLDAIIAWLRELN